MNVLAVNASPSDTSRTHALAAAAVEVAGSGRVVDLGSLPADALLGRTTDPAVDALLEDLRTEALLLLATPVYRATYTGLLKVVFDQLREGDLEGTACVLAATAATPAHFLSLDTGMRALVASLGGWSVPTVVYAVGDDVSKAGPVAPAVDQRLRRALAEAGSVTGGLPDA